MHVERNYSCCIVRYRVFWGTNLFTQRIWLMDDHQLSVKNIYFLLAYTAHTWILSPGDPCACTVSREGKLNYKVFGCMLFQVFDLAQVFKHRNLSDFVSKTTETKSMFYATKYISFESVWSQQSIYKLLSTLVQMPWRSVSLTGVHSKKRILAKIVQGAPYTITMSPNRQNQRPHASSVRCQASAR